MKSHLLALTMLFILGGLNINAQEQKMKPDESRNSGSAVRSPIITMQLKGEIHTPSADLKWRPILTKKYIDFEPQTADEALIKQIKEQKLKLKQQLSINPANSFFIVVSPLCDAQPATLPRPACGERAGVRGNVSLSPARRR